MDVTRPVVLGLWRSHSLCDLGLTLGRDIDLRLLLLDTIAGVAGTDKPLFKVAAGDPGRVRTQPAFAIVGLSFTVAPLVLDQPLVDGGLGGAHTLGCLAGNKRTFTSGDAFEGSDTWRLLCNLGFKFDHLLGVAEQQGAQLGRLIGCKRRTLPGLKLLPPINQLCCEFRAQLGDDNVAVALALLT